MKSKIEVGSPLCTWSQSKQFCSLTPPPSDPIFVILVALITLILVVPIVSLINYVLENYARKSPIGRGFEDDFTYEVATSQQTKDDLYTTDQLGFAAKSPGMIGGAKVTPFEIAQSSYNGTYVTDIPCVLTLSYALPAFQ